MEEIAQSASAAALWSGLCVLLFLVLSTLVTRQRRAHRVSVGDGGVDTLVRASRAFGNAAEYLPIGLAVMALMVTVGAPPASLHLAGAVLLLGRVLHAVGMSRSSSPTPERAAGMLLTWLFLVGGAVTLVFHAL